jgi:hypothetical protein
MIFLAAIVALAMVLGIGWFAVQAQRGESGWQKMRETLKRLRRGADAPEIDEAFAEQLAPVDQQARDKGAV